MLFGGSVYCCFCRVVMPADMQRYPELILCCDDAQRICIGCMRKAEIAAKTDDAHKPIKRCLCGTVITLQTLYYLARRFEHNRRQEQQNMQMMASWTRNGFCNYEPPQQRGMRSSYVFPPKHHNFNVDEFPEETDVQRHMRPISPHRSMHNIQSQPQYQPSNHFRISERKHTPDTKYLPIRQEESPEMQKLSRKFSIMNIQQQQSEIQVDRVRQSVHMNIQQNHQINQPPSNQPPQNAFFNHTRGSYQDRPKSANNVMRQSKASMMASNREPSFGNNDAIH